MSGVLSDLNSILSLFEGGLADATFAGIDFVMVKHDEAPGRRALRFLFPGRDNPQYEDLGIEDDPISVVGFYVGDDYVQQLGAFRAAAHVQGPQTLVHPWLGTFQVIFAAKPRFSLSADELRVLRIEMQFWQFSAPQPAPASTLSKLLAAIAAVRAAVTEFLDDVLAVQQLFSGAVGYVTGFVGSLAGAWTILAATVGTDASGGPLRAAIAQLGGIDLIVPGTAYGSGVAGLIAAPSLALSTAAAPPVAAAVAPGSVSATPALADPRVVANTLLAAAPAIAALPTSVLPGPALICAALADVASDAMASVLNIPFTSQQEAQGWLDRTLVVLDQAAAEAALSAVSWPVTAGALWRALIAARAAFSADLSLTIGRLPPVVTLVLPGGGNPVSLWLVATYLAGDDPTQIVATYQDLLSRNAIVNPAIVAGALETLQ